MATVYVIIGGLDSYDHAKWIAGVFATREALLEQVNADPDMTATVNAQGDLEVRGGAYWYTVEVIELDRWE